MGRYERAQIRRVFEEEKAQIDRALEDMAKMYRGFEEEKKHLDLEYEDAKSKGWYRKMKNVAKASAELNQKMEMIEEEAKRRQTRFMRKMRQEGEGADLDEEHEEEEEIAEEAERMAGDEEDE